MWFLKDKKEEKSQKKVLHTGDEGQNRVKKASKGSEVKCVMVLLNVFGRFIFCKTLSNTIILFIRFCNFYIIKSSLL